MASRGILTNPIVQVTLALVVILVIATLTFASAISGALNTLREKTFFLIHVSQNLMCVQTAEKLRNPLISWNCNNRCWITRTGRANMGFEKDGRSIVNSSITNLLPSIVSIGV